MVNCSILGCKSRTERKHDNITFHTFPKKIASLKLWVSATGRTDWAVTPSSRICSKHFEEKYLKKSKKKTSLQIGSIPTIDVHDLHEVILDSDHSSSSTNTAIETPESMEEENYTVLATSTQDSHFTQDVDLDNKDDIQLVDETQDVDLDNKDNIQLLDDTQDVDVDNKDNIQLLDDTQDVNLDHIQLLDDTQNVHLDHIELLDDTQDVDVDNKDKIQLLPITQDVHLNNKEDIPFMVIGTGKESITPGTSGLVTHLPSNEITRLQKELQTTTVLNKKQELKIQAYRDYVSRLLKRNTFLCHKIKKLGSAPVTRDGDIETLRLYNQQLQEKNASLVGIITNLKSQSADDYFACASSAPVCESCGSCMVYTK